MKWWQKNLGRALPPNLDKIQKNSSFLFVITSLISALHFDDHIQHLILLQGVDGDRDERMGAATRNLALCSTKPGQTDKW